MTLQASNGRRTAVTRQQQNALPVSLLTALEGFPALANKSDTDQVYFENPCQFQAPANLSQAVA